MCVKMKMMKTINLINTVNFDYLTGMPITPGNAYPDQAQFSDNDVVKRKLWYHASNNPQWLEDVVRNNAPVHLGSKQSAFDRMNLLSEYTSEGDEWFIYAVWLTYEATVADHYVEDMLDEWVGRVFADTGMTDDEWFDTTLFDSPDPVLDKDFNKTTQGNSFVRYVNMHENPGHISLFGNPVELDFAGVFVVDKDKQELTELDPENTNPSMSYTYKDFHATDFDKEFGS